MPASHDWSPTDKRYGVVSVYWMLLDSIRRGGVALLARPFRGLVLWYRDLRFARRMREEGRFMPWPQLKPRLLKGDGTLILERATSAGRGSATSACSTSPRTCKSNCSSSSFPPAADRLWRYARS